jgi:neutral ceramidase
MDQHYDSKAGPSQLQPRWSEQRSGWRRQTLKAIAFVAALALGYLAFVHLSHDGLESNWLWRTTTQDGNRKEGESSRRSQYLLGVGKADITGLAFKGPSCLIEH